MHKVTIDDIKACAENSREALYEQAHSVGLENPLVILHWSAGWGSQCYDDYHINITTDGEIYATTENFSETLPHTWHLNTGTVGVSLCCAAGATTEYMGEEPPTDIQIELMAQVIAVLCEALWLTCSRMNVLTHGEAGDDERLYDEDDLYGPNNDCERWDLQYLDTPESPYFIADHDDPRTGGNVLRGKANWYIQQRKEAE